jgi:hypothetical protein
MSLSQFMNWYSKMDKDTIELAKRFFAKGVATGNLNNYLKRVFQAELNTIDVASTQGERNNGRP